MPETPDLKARIKHFGYRVADLYIDGFRNMTVGRTLWAIIAFKVVVILIVMKFLFFPNLLKRDFDNDADRADHVRQVLTTRSQTSLPSDSIPQSSSPTVAEN